MLFQHAISRFRAKIEMYINYIFCDITLRRSSILCFCHGINMCGWKAGEWYSTVPDMVQTLVLGDTATTSRRYIYSYIVSETLEKTLFMLSALPWNYLIQISKQCLLKNLPLYQKSWRYSLPYLYVVLTMHSVWIHPSL